MGPVRQGRNESHVTSLKRRHATRRLMHWKASRGPGRPLDSRHHGENLPSLTLVKPGALRSWHEATVPVRHGGSGC